MLEGTSIDCFAFSFVSGLIGRIMLYPASSSNQVVTIRPTGQIIYNNTSYTAGASGYRKILALFTPDLCRLA